MTSMTVASSNRYARWAVLAIFFINGALLSNWVARIPDIQRKLSLSEGALGIVLLGLSVGVLTALTMAGGLVARFGSRAVTTVTTFLLCGALPLLALAPSPVLLWMALFIFGATLSTMDVAMNAQAVEVERRHDKPLMSSFHASFSIGAFFGAVIGSFLTDLSPLNHFLFASVVGFVGALIAVRPLVDVDGEKQSGGSVFRLPERSLWMLGAVAFAGAIGEGAMADWSTVYLTNVVQTDTSTAALGFASFSLMMTVGRAAGDWITAHINVPLLVRGGGILAAIGLFIAILLPDTIPVIIGFGLVGAGISITIPLAFSAVGKMPGIAPGAGIAGVATIGYAGFLAGPPILGLIAEFTSLRISLGLVAFVVATLVITGGALAIETDANADAEHS